MLEYIWEIDLWAMRKTKFFSIFLLNFLIYSQISYGVTPKFVPLFKNETRKNHEAFGKKFLHRVSDIRAVGKADGL